MEIQKVILHMLSDILEVCAKYNLIVMLGGGSALGAVRHQGFIPWDDDIDLNMPRKDYEKLKDVFNEELSASYNLYCPQYNHSAIERFAKIEKKDTCFWPIDAKESYGICIDIFPIENIPKRGLMRLGKGGIAQLCMFIAGQVKFWENKNKWMRMFMCTSYKGKITYYLKCFIGVIFSFIPAYKWFDWCDKVNQYKYTGVMGVPSGRKHYFGEIFPENVYFPTKKAYFEDLEIRLPNKVEIYLSNLYGDYSRIPSKEEQEKHFVLELKI